MAGSFTKLLGSALYGGALGAGTGALNAYLTGRPPAESLGPGAVGGALGAGGSQLAGGLLSRGVWPTLRPFVSNPEGPRATRGRALTQFSDLLHDDELSTDQLRRGLDPGGGLPTLSGPGGLPLTLADVGGINTLGRAGAAARTPGPSQNRALQTVEARRKLYPQFVLDAVRQHLTPTYDLNQTAKDLQDRKQADAKRLYDAALNETDPVTGKTTPKIVSDPALNPLLDRLYNVGAFKKAEQLAKAYGEPAPKPIVPPDPDAGTPGQYYLTGRQADLVKQGLDGLIGKTYGSAEPDRALGRAYTQLKHEYVGTLEPLLPGYDLARQVFSDHSTSQQALESGRKFDQGHVDDQLDYFSSLDPGDQDFFRVGMGQRANDMVGEPGATTNRIRKYFNNDPLNKAQAFFPDPASYQAFTGKLGKVADMAETDAKIYGNSATQQRLTEEGALKHADALDSPLMRVFSSEGGGDIWRALGAEGLRMLTADPEAIHKATAAELTNMLLNPRHQDNMQLLDRLDKAQRNRRVRDVISSVLGDTAATAGGIGGGKVATTSPPDPDQQPEPPPEVTPPDMAEGGRVNPLAQGMLDVLDPAYQKKMNDARRSDTFAPGFWTDLLAGTGGEREPEPTTGERAMYENFSELPLKSGEQGAAELAPGLEQARRYSEAERAADEAYRQEREVGGDAYAARRLAPLSETGADASGSHRYLTPGGRAVDYGWGDATLPGTDELYSALRATGDRLAGRGGDWGENYSGWLADRRNAGEHWEQVHPWQSKATMLAPVAGYGALSKAARWLPRLLRGPATLSALGAGYGFAGGQGGTASRLRNAARGAAFGVDVPAAVDRWTGM